MTQMIAMRYGTIPIARERGGLANTAAVYAELYEAMARERRTVAEAGDQASEKASGGGA